MLFISNWARKYDRSGVQCAPSVPHFPVEKQTSQIGGGEGRLQTHLLLQSEVSPLVSTQIRWRPHSFPECQTKHHRLLVSLLLLRQQQFEHTIVNTPLSNKNHQRSASSWDLRLRADRYGCRSAKEPATSTRWHFD